MTPRPRAPPATTCGPSTDSPASARVASHKTSQSLPTTKNDLKSSSELQSQQPPHQPPTPQDFAPATKIPEEFQGTPTPIASTSATNSAGFARPDTWRVQGNSRRNLSPSINAKKAQPKQPQHQPTTPQDFAPQPHPWNSSMPSSCQLLLAFCHGPRQGRCG